MNLRDGPTGPEIARRMAAEHGITVVFVTANPGQIGECAGALGYVRKPFSERAILAAAAAACNDATPANDDVVMLGDRSAG